MSLATYADRRETNVAWCPEVPAHWQLERLKRAGRLVADKSDDKRHVVALENVEGWTGRLVSGISEYQGEGIAFREGDILFGKLRPYLAKVYLAKGSGSAVGDFFVVRPASTTVPRFLQYLLLSPVFIDLVNGSTFGSKMPRASWEFLSTIPLPTPPLSEQVAVADFLDLETAKIDALVAAQRRLMTLVAEKRRAVVSHAVTRGLNTRAPIKSSGIEWIGDIPMHWSVQRLKYLADIRTGIAKGKDHGSVATVEVPYLRVANVQDGFVDLADVAMMPVPTGDVERFKLREGDVLMNEGGDFDKLGRGAVWRGQVDPCVTQNHVFAVRPLDVESEWLAAYTGSASAQFYFMTRSKQSTNLASISSTNIMELPVVVPPKSERAAILEFIGSQIAALDGLNTSALRTMDLLLERRAALITAAVTGQIDVRHAVATMAVA